MLHPLRMAAMSHASPTREAPRANPVLICFAAAATMLLVVAAWLTRGSLNAFEYNQFVPAVMVLLTDALPVIGWFVAAWGFGSLISRAMDAGTPAKENARMSLGLGIAAMLWLDHALGAAGLLQAGGGVGAWALLAVGWALALLALRRCLASQRESNARGDWSIAMLLATVPALALLLVAATSAPGWLWRSEAHGYDVLEYHLQLPREWLALGSLTPLKHNVYSYAPSYVEAAYYHLAILLDPLATRPADGAIQAATACQLLHAALMIWAASEIVLLVLRGVSRWIGLAAGAIAVSVPWVIVTGSMAYNEAVLIGMLALCWRLIDMRQTSMRSLALLGFLAGVACGAKLTALGGIALPIAVLLLMTTPPAQWPRSSLAGAVGGAIALGPYLIRNFAALDGANPFFPLFMNALGHAHWTAEQAQRWNEAHAADEPWLDRFAALWTMGFAQAQWAGLWIMALLAAPLAWMSRPHRPLAFEALIILALQLGFWLAMTHLQSRFLLPCLPSLIVLIALAIQSMAARAQRAAIAVAIAIPILMGCWSVHLYQRERGGHPATYIDGV